LFVAKTAVDVALEQIVRAGDDDHFAISAYCFMPDHLHLLVEGKSESSNCLRFITRAKQFSGYHFKRQFGQRLWQRAHSEGDESTLIVARYILENPLRAGLVERSEDYPFLGSRTYQLAELLDAIGSVP
jgi:putative transposase